MGIDLAALGAMAAKIAFETVGTAKFPATYFEAGIPLDPVTNMPGTPPAGYPIQVVQDKGKEREADQYAYQDFLFEAATLPVVPTEAGMLFFNGVYWSIYAVDNDPVNAHYILTCRH
jgi:hypothetical protein